MKSSLSLVNKEQIASFGMAGLMLAVAPLLLMLATANTGYSQTSDNVAPSTAAASSPSDWTQFHRDNMQRWNPYETVLGVNNVRGLQSRGRPQSAATSTS